jgi:hypothetical protein
MMATAYASAIQFTGGVVIGKAMSNAKTLTGKFLASEAIIQAGLNEIYLLTNGEFDLATVLKNGAIAGAASEALSVAPEVLSAFFRKLGEYIDLGQTTNKAVKSVATSNNPLSIELLLRRQSLTRARSTSAA